MALHLQPTPDDPDIMAVMYGPMTLVGLVDPHANRLAGMSGRCMISPIGHLLDNWYLIADRKRPADWLTPVAGRMGVFETKGINRSIRFVPLYEVVEESYGLYWRVLDKHSPKIKAIQNTIQQQIQRENQQVIDRVIPGDPESGSVHRLKLIGESKCFNQAGYTWREGHWSWQMNCLPDQPVSLLLSEHDVMNLAGHSYFATTHKFYLAVSSNLVDRVRQVSTVTLGQNLAHTLFFGGCKKSCQS